MTALAAIIRRRKRWFIAIAGVCIVLVGLVLIEIRSKTRADSAAMYIDTFMRAIQEKHFDEAYKMLHPPESLMSADDFTRSPLANYKIIKWNRFTFLDSYGHVEACGDINTPDGWIPFQMILDEQGDSWTINDFKYGGYVGAEPSNSNGVCNFW